MSDSFRGMRKRKHERLPRLTQRAFDKAVKTFGKLDATGCVVGGRRWLCPANDAHVVSVFGNGLYVCGVCGCRFVKRGEKIIRLMGADDCAGIRERRAGGSQYGNILIDGVELVKRRGSVCRDCGEEIGLGQSVVVFFVSWSEASYNPWTACSGKVHVICPKRVNYKED